MPLLGTIGAAASRGFGFLTSVAAAVDEYFKYVTLLLHGNGTNGAQNNTFLDSSTNNFTITRNGNTTQGTFTPYGTLWSNYFGGDGNYLSAPYNAAFSFSTGDFSIECFASVEDAGRTADANKYGCLVGFAAPGGNTNLWGLVIRIVGGVITEVIFGTDLGDNVASGLSISLNQFHHFAACRTGTTLSIFVDGTRVLTTTNSSAINANTGGSLNVARSPYVSNYQNWTKGYISNVRVVKGASAYSASSTTITVPTSPLTAISGTSLLTCADNRFRDSSTNNFTVSVTGSPSVQRFSPFAPPAPYSTSVIGGSGYFDGTGDYLALSNVAALQPGASTTAFSIECWIYPTAQTGTDTAVFGNYKVTSYPTNTDGFDLLFNSSSSLAFRWGYPNYADSGSSPTLALNSWNHVVVCRNASGSMSCFLNGARWFNTSTNTSITTASAASFWVGWAGSLSGTTINPFLGYIAGFSFVKGATTYDPTTSTLTIPTAPPTNSGNTSLLMNYTNGGIIDNAMMNDLETVGNAQISTSVRKFGGGSMYFDGTGDWLSMPSSPIFSFGGNVTIECWIYPSSLSGSASTAYGICGTHSGFSDGKFALFAYANGRVGISSIGVSEIVSPAGTITTNNWYHLAVVRNGSTTTVYVNGVNVASSTTNVWSTGASSFFVGYLNPSNGNTWNGYIDDLRVTQGIARYTANFTPPTSQLQDQ